jgi:hydroxymethylbilane synthase
VRAVRIGTRGSALALAQARLVAEALTSVDVDHEMVIVETEGDRRAPDTAWGEGAFVTAIERALLDGRADVAVHSAKDVPTDEDPNLLIAAYLPRQDPRDALVVAAGAQARTLEGLPAGSVIGTDSPRRTGFLLSRRPDLTVRPLHGNVDTRLRRLDNGEVDALVLAVAGLVRLDRADRIDERLPADVLPPAPGQGAIAVQVRADDQELIALARLIDDQPTRLAVEAERAFLRAASGGCRAPIGALADVTDSLFRLLGGFATVDGRQVVVDSVDGPLDDRAHLAQALASRLGSRQAMQPGRRRVLITRAQTQSGGLAARLADHGIEAVVVPAIAVELAGPGGPLDAALGRLADYDWAVVTSANGARAVAAAASRTGADVSAVRWAAVGRASASEMRAAGAQAVWQPTLSTGDGLARELPLEQGERVLLVRGSLADEALPRRLRERGAEVHDVTGYVTHEAPAASRRLLEEAFAAGPVDGVLFASPSAVRGLLALAGVELHATVLALPAIAIGPTTAAAVRDAGLLLLGESETQDAVSLAELTARLIDRTVAGAPA